jgi:3-oxoacyl-[acyl-carrier-protein] synthase II
MKAFIRATGNVSPQQSFGHGPLLQQLVTQTGNRLHCTEPDYSMYIDPKFIRRMSRIIKMGVAAAMECLKEAGVQNPDAIVMGTAYGCLEDTGSFIKKMVEQNEEMLTPTAFIQSTHNTIGAQVALLLQCHNYNNTFVHRGFSFESALLDAMMLLEENAADNVLTGAADEITGYSHALLSRFGLYKQDAGENTDLFAVPSKGTIAGEGAAFFLLAKKASGHDYALLEGLHTFYKPENIAAVQNAITDFLLSNDLSATDIDLVITGRNGDAKGDAVYQAVTNHLFASHPIAHYKHLCGEYPTSTAFALWLAAAICQQQHVPPVLGSVPIAAPKRILVYNHYQNIHHSLMLVSAC